MSASTPSSSFPPTVAGFDAGRLFSPFIHRESAVVAAVSGGSDSTALLVLLHIHLRRRAPDTKLVAVTVDHGLRPEAQTEARAVAQLAAKLGVAHRTVRWEGEKPETGVIAAAREARHRLLAEAAAEAGARLIFTGHTADDQAETVAMRLARDGDGGRGLAGMAPLTLYGTRFSIVRPLLGMRRAELRAVLRENGTSWTEDATNADPRWERGRVRAQLEGDEARTADLLGVADAAGRERTRLGEAAAALIGEFVSQPSPGLFRIDRALLAPENAQAAVYALRLLLAAVGGNEHLPDTKRVEALWERMQAGPLRFALARVVIDRRRDAAFMLREGRVPHPWRERDYGPKGDTLWPLGAATVWTGRFMIEAKRDLPGMAVMGWSGYWASEYLKKHPVPGVPAELGWQALSRQPALWAHRQPAIALEPRLDPELLTERVCQANGLTVTPVVAPFARYLPLFDLVPARALSLLIGAPPLPSLPDGADRLVPS